MLVHSREQPNNASNGCRGRGRKRPARERRWLTWIAHSITGCVSISFTGHGPRFLYFGKQLASDLYEKIVLFSPLPSPLSRSAFRLQNSARFREAMAASLKVRLLRVCQRELRRTVRVTVDARMRVLVFRSFYDRSLDQVAFTWKFL